MWRSNRGTNSIGWLLWHLTRSHDRSMIEIHGCTQRWIVDGWCVRFGRWPDPCDTGYEHSPGEAVEFRSPGVEVLRGYHRAVVEMVDSYLDAAPDDDLDRLASSPTLPVRARLTGVLNEGLQHVGQAAMIRGILQRRAH